MKISFHILSFPQAPVKPGQAPRACLPAGKSGILLKTQKDSGQAGMTN